MANYLTKSIAIAFIKNNTAAIFVTLPKKASLPYGLK